MKLVIFVIMLLLCASCSPQKTVLVDSTAPVTITEQGGLQVVDIETLRFCNGVPQVKTESVSFRCKEGQSNSGFLGSFQSAVDEVSDSVTIPLSLIVLLVVLF